MHSRAPIDQSYARLHLLYQIELASLGFGTFALAAFSDAAAALIAFAAGRGLIASAFTGFPKVIVLHIRKSYGIRPTLETINAVGLPLFMAMSAAWMTSSSARQLDYLPNSEAPSWNYDAEPWIFGAIVLMNLGVLVANIISLASERRQPR